MDCEVFRVVTGFSWSCFVVGKGIELAVCVFFIVKLIVCNVLGSSWVQGTFVECLKCKFES